MDQIQKTLIKAGRKDLAQKYYIKIAGSKPIRLKSFGQSDADKKKIIERFHEHSDYGKHYRKLINNLYKDSDKYGKSDDIRDTVNLLPKPRLDYWYKKIETIIKKELKDEISAREFEIYEYEEDIKKEKEKLKTIDKGDRGGRSSIKTDITYARGRIRALKKQLMELK